MDMNIVVGAVIAIIVIADVAYLLWKRKKGQSVVCDCGGSCGSCNCGCNTSQVNVTIDEGEGRNRGPATPPDTTLY